MLATKTTYEIFYNGKNVSRDIVPFVKGLSYTDNTTKESDEIEILLDDSLKLWQFDWYPTKGDKMQIKIFSDEGTLNCGVFTIDQMTANFTGDGDEVTIKAIAAGTNNELRTIRSYAHEHKSIREIANTIASKNGITLEGEIPNVRINRKTQYRTTDLAFLQQLANDYGYTFSIRDNRMTFTSIFELEGKPAALVIHRKDIKSASFTDKTSQTFKAVQINYHNPKKKEVISYGKKESDPAFKDVKGDTLVLHSRVENQPQAEIVAKTALYNANSLQQEGIIDVVGNVFLVAGINIELVGFGVFSGRYFIRRSTHIPTAGDGYITSIDIKRVGLVDKSLYK